MQVLSTSPAMLLALQDVASGCPNPLHCSSASLQPGVAVRTRPATSMACSRSKGFPRQQGLVGSDCSNLHVGELERVFKQKLARGCTKTMLRVWLIMRFFLVEHPVAISSSLMQQ